MTSTNLLRSARKLITDHRNWINPRDYFLGIHNVRAMDARGVEVRPEAPAACRFTLDGALWRCACASMTDAEMQGDYHQAVQYLRSMAKGKTLAEINDLKSHGAILEMLDRAAVALNVSQRIAA